MSQATASAVRPVADAYCDTEVVRKRWTSMYRPIAAELERVDALLRAELRSNDSFVDSLVKHAYRLGGKRLRPALLLLCGKACQPALSSDHITLGAVVEMIHTATLVHDDVLDEATLRRHRETVNALCDNEASILVGDFLFTHAFYLASSLETTFGCRTIGRATNIVCAGEMQQINSRGNFNLTEAQYLDIIEAKTAELTACCCRLGAHYAQAGTEIEESLDRYGRMLGIAFQIVDDMLDLTGEESQAGKSLGTDMEKQKLTLPVIRLLAKSSEQEKSSLLDLLQRGGIERRAQLRAALLRTDALQYARARAVWYSQQALRELDGLPDSDAKTVLAGLTEFVVGRRE